MIFTVTKTSDWTYYESKEIETLDELLQFVRDNGQVIINRVLDFEKCNDDQFVATEEGFALEIYDSYRE